MKRLLIFLFSSIIIYSSCTKEKSIEGTPLQTDSLLIKKVINLGADSDTYSYSYDNSRRLIAQHYTSTSQGSTYNEQINLRRNGQGIIQQLILKSDSLSTINLDSLVYNISYDAVTSHYTSAVAALTIFGFSVRDSTAYTYNNAGKIIKSENFFDDGTSGGYAEASKEEYTYGGDGNIVNVKNSTFDSTTGVYKLTSEEDYEYDTKTNPLPLGMEAILISDPTLAGGNNVTKITSTDYIDPTQNSSATFLYQYNTLGKPDSGNATYAGSGSTPLTYYYH